MTNEKSTENVELLGNKFHTVTGRGMFKSKLDTIKFIEKKKL